MGGGGNWVGGARDCNFRWDSSLLPEDALTGDGENDLIAAN